MKAISSTRKRDPNVEPDPMDEIQESIYPDQHEDNITEGSEYLDDALRMKDQPFGDTPENNQQ